VIRQVYEKHTFDVMNDVAAGHGAQGALFGHIRSWQRKLS
jgi:hypothetical protein